MRFIWMIALVVSCQQSREMPDDLISKDEFTDILYEIEIIDAIEIQNMGGSNHSDTLTLANYKFLFDSIGISKERFDLSFEYYQRDRDLMMEITDSLLQRINREEERISKKLRDQRWRNKKEDE